MHIGGTHTLWAGFQAHLHGFRVGLGMELRALGVLGACSAPEPCPCLHLSFIYFISQVRQLRPRDTVPSLSSDPETQSCGRSALIPEGTGQCGQLVLAGTFHFPRSCFSSLVS